MHIQYVCSATCLVYSTNAKCIAIDTSPLVSDFPLSSCYISDCRRYRSILCVEASPTCFDQIIPSAEVIPTYILFTTSWYVEMTSIRVVQPTRSLQRKLRYSRYLNALRRKGNNSCFYVVWMPPYLAAMRHRSHNISWRTLPSMEIVRTTRIRNTAAQRHYCARCSMYCIQSLVSIF